jgi:hypothetical protein
MKKYGFHYLLAALLVVALAGACVSPFEGFEPPAEYDAQGRRLVTVTIDLENASRAVNTAVAKAYIDFYEVVFENGTEYYSATLKRGAGRRLSLRVPAGVYNAYLYAGHLEDNGDAVLLAQSNAITGQDTASNLSWDFTLTALNLGIGSGNQSHTNDSIYVAEALSPNTGLNIGNSGGVPYFVVDSSTTHTVTVTIKTTVLNSVKYSNDSVDIKAIPPVDGVDITISPDYAANGSFGAEIAVTGGAKGVSNIGFDVTVALKSLTRSNGLDPVRWHIRNGLDVEQLDIGVSDITSKNIGAGTSFAFGDITPPVETSSIEINITL